MVGLYYKKIQPKYHLRDNHLGRKINLWIEEDLERLREQDPSKFVTPNPRASKPGRKSKIHTNEDGTTPRKRKPNSSKEGTQPAYLNVELVNPPKTETGDYPYDYLNTLSNCCVESQGLEWNKETLEEDVSWFRENRNTLMDAIPSLSTRSKQNAKKTKDRTFQ